MRALAGPAMLLVMVGGFFIHRCSSKEVAPARDFTELEFAGADRTGTCYSLSTVLIANRLPSSTSRTWSTPRDDAWTLALDDVIQGPAGPVHVFQKLTFEKRDGQVRLVAVEASKEYPTDIKANIDRLLEAPHEIRSTPVDRCLQPGATGYLFTPRR